LFYDDSKTALFRLKNAVYSVFYGFMMMLGSGKVMVVVAILKIRPEMVIWRLTGYMLLTFGPENVGP
jgi:uncharacterized membrane protein YccF (DUF307 family)